MGRVRLASLRFFGVGDISEAFGIHPANVRRLIKEGRLRAHRLGDKGSRWRVSEADFMTFVRTTRLGLGWGLRRVFGQRN